MRNLFLALLLINLLVWAGFSWFGPNELPVSRYDGPGITLVREVEAAADSGLRLGEQADARTTDRDGSNLEFRSDDVANEAADIGLEGSEEQPDGAVGDGATTAQEIDGNETEANGSGAPEAAVSAEEAPLLARQRTSERCLAVGPFVEPADAEAAQELLAEDGLSANAVRSEEEVWDGYWVFLEGIESNEVASEMLERLEANGVEDTQLISRSESGGILISLGVYSGLTRAGTRAEEVSRLGYEATVTERTRVAEVSWLQVMLDSDQSIEIDPLRPPGRISRLELRACEN